MDYTLPSQASARVVVPSLVALTLLAAVAFGGLYESVHGGLPPEIARPLSSSTAVIAHVIQAQIAGLAVGSTPAVTEEDWKEPAAPTDTDAGL
jgi:predicted MFS family arabinose efflux permease